MIYIHSNSQYNLRPLKDLNLINSFLFDSSMENPENAKFIAKTIIKRATGRVLTDFTVETQKQLKEFLKSKASFNSLPELISIWILPYDPFGQNRMLYTVKNQVTEDNKLLYNDGITNLFLYNSVKSNRKVGERYISLEKIYEAAKQNFYEAGKEAGLSEGHKVGLDEGHKLGLDEGIKAFIEILQENSSTSEQIKNKLLLKFNISESDAEEYLKRYYK